MSIKANSEEVITGTIQDFNDIDNAYWVVADKFAALSDAVENNEPLQARQTFAEIKAYMEEVERYVESISPEEGDSGKNSSQRPSVGVHSQTTNRARRSSRGNDKLTTSEGRDVATVTTVRKE